MIPPRTILAATDLSDPATTALVCAARLARHCGAALHVVHAEHPLLRAAAEQNGIDLAGQTRDELRRVIEAASAAESSPAIHTGVGNAVEVILDTAHRIGADLVVLGAHGMSGAERLVFGSTTEGVLRKSGVSTLVVPARWMPPRPAAVDLAGVGPVIAGVDFSGPSLLAARAACALANTLGTTVEMVHVVPELAVPQRWQRQAEQAMRERVGVAGKELEGAVRGLGCTAPHAWRVEAGPVARCLATVAGDAADRSPFLVLGRDASRSGGSPPGATAYRVLSAASVPVLMVVG
jgi:nucleotide-binding universal stress UspA family protein